MNAMLDLKVSELLRNARILALKERWTSLAVILTLLLTTIFMIAVFPISQWIFLLFLFSFIQYSFCTFIYDSVLKQIVTPYEQNKQAQM